MRLQWLFLFAETLFNNIVDKPELELKKCALDAYDVALKSHHPWALKKAAKMAMGLIGTRESMSKKLRVPDLKDMAVSREHFKTIGDYIKAEMTNRKMFDLP